MEITKRLVGRPSVSFSAPLISIGTGVCVVVVTCVSVFVEPVGTVEVVVTSVSPESEPLQPALSSKPNTNTLATFIDLLLI
jgi:hypothetical protein